MIQGQACQDHDRQDRAAGALYGLAVGDALGMPTESLPRPEIAARYGPLLEEFQPGAPDQPLAPGLPAGTITDDTEQALLLAHLIDPGEGRDRRGRLRPPAAGLGRGHAGPRLAEPAGPLHQEGPVRAAHRDSHHGERPQRDHQRRGHADHPCRRGHPGRGPGRPCRAGGDGQPGHAQHRRRAGRGRCSRRGGQRRGGRRDGAGGDRGRRDRRPPPRGRAAGWRPPTWRPGSPGPPG